MDKQTESRSQFEAWMSDNWNHPRAIEKTGDAYILTTTRTQWEAWTASRESLVVELPKSGFYLGYGCPEYMERDDVIDTLRAIGIRIKGEGDGASS